MINRQSIQTYANAVALEFQPERIVLFGSHAYGAPDAGSDVDLLVIMPHKGKARDKAAEIRTRLSAPFALDLLVRSPETIRDRIAKEDWFIREIMEKGKTLYEAAHARVD